MIVTGILLVLFPSLVFAWVSNPQGYLVGRYTQYSYCDGSTTSQVAQAIGQCVYSGLIGYPRINTYTMYSSPYESDGETFINAVSYYDKNCTKVAGTAVPTKLNACTTSGSSIYFTFSQNLPQFSGGYVEQTVFNYTGEATTNCSSDSMVMSIFNFGAGCLYDCGGGSSSCQFYSCASGSSTGENGAALFLQYSQEYCPVANYEYTATYESSCQSTITCVPQSDDDDGLSTDAIIGITFVATFDGTLMFVALGIFCYFRYRGKSTTGLNENLV